MGKSLFPTLKAYIGFSPLQKKTGSFLKHRKVVEDNSRNLFYLQPDLVHAYSEVGPSEFNGTDSQATVQSIIWENKPA